MLLLLGLLLSTPTIAANKSAKNAVTPPLEIDQALEASPGKNLAASDDFREDLQIDAKTVPDLPLAPAAGTASE